MNTHGQHTPNLFFIGAMKSGTSTLNKYLDTHPDIYMSTPREPSYFVEHRQLKNIWPDMAAKNCSHKLDAYISLYDDAGSAKIIGESSTNYTKLNRLTGVAQRLADFSPDAKLLYIMRDPVERTLSHYWHHVHRHGESNNPLTAITEDDQYTDPSYYAMQLKPYFARFPEENIYILSFEQLLHDTQNTVQKIYSWLGINNSFIPPSLDEKRHVTPTNLIQVSGRGLLHKFSRSRFWDAVSPLVPRGIRSRGRHMAEKEIDKAAVDVSGVVEYLRPIQREQTAELASMLGREFREWKTLFNDQ